MVTNERSIDERILIILTKFKLFGDDIAGSNYCFADAKEMCDVCVCEPQIVNLLQILQSDVGR